MSKIRIFIVLLAFAGHVAVASPLSGDAALSDEARKMRTIVLDAGHGGRDFGALGIRTKAKEKDVALQVTLKLGKKIEKEMPDVKVVYTRTTDEFVPLYARPEVANKYKADLFISIHCNSGGVRRVRRRNSKGQYYTSRVVNTTATGTETIVSGSKRLPEQDAAIRDDLAARGNEAREDDAVIEDAATRENASILLEDNYQEHYGGFDPNDPSSMILLQLMKNKFRDESVKLARHIQESFKAAGRKDRGVLEQSLAVLARTGMPAVLTEIGFMSNPEEEKFLLSAAGQNQIVTSLFDAIKSYLDKK